MSPTTARIDRPVALALLVAGVTATLASLGSPTPSRAEACPPHCATPIVTPAWHLHMCDQSYEDQLVDNHCMNGDGVTEFPEGTNQVYIIYCHRAQDLVVVQVHDTGGGLQFVNHPDGVTYPVAGCDSMVFSQRNGIAPAGSPYFTSAYWPEGPFHGVSRGVSWFIGLFIAFDQDNYYGNAAEAQITARDPGASLDPLVVESITARVTSDSDPAGIAITLKEEASALALFRAVRPLRFSTVASDEAAGVIKVANRDTVRVSYCPRNCTRPYEDAATWYQLVATVTPTSLPTWPGPSATPTTTPLPEVRTGYATLRPATDDVGYACQLTNRGLPNHLGYPTIYAGMWTRGKNLHYGMVQFDLSVLPDGATITDARLEMVGRDKDFTDPGEWSVKLLDPAIDGIWRAATFSQVAEAGVLAQIGRALTEPQLAEGKVTAVGFSQEQLWLLNARLEVTKRASFRVDGPPGPENNLFGWHSGVDKYRREPVPPDPSLGPVLALTYRVDTAGPSPTAWATAGTGTETVPVVPSGTPGTGPQPTSARPTSPSPEVPWPTNLWPTPTAGPGTPSASPTGGTPVGATYTPDASAMPSGTPAATSTDRSPAVTSAPTSSATAGPATPSATATGPAEQRQVCVIAFDDEDDDGLRGRAERFLPNVTVKLTHAASGAFVTWTTDGQNEPDYCWIGLTDGAYTIETVQVPLGYVTSGPASFRFGVPFPGEPAVFAFALRRSERPTPTSPPPWGASPTAAAATPTRAATSAPSATWTPSITPSPTPQPTVTGPSGEICVAAFDDADLSGDRQRGEALLRDVLVTISDVERHPMRGLRTVDGGLVCSRLSAGVYYVSASPVEGRRSTTPAEVAVLLTAQQRHIVEFGLGPSRLVAALHVPIASR